MTIATNETIRELKKYIYYPKWKKARKQSVIIEFREVIPNWVSKSNILCEQIKTRKGVLYAYPDTDYIIKGIEGEIHPIKKNIFNKTYEIIEEDV